MKKIIEKIKKIVLPGEVYRSGIEEMLAKTELQVERYRRDLREDQIPKNVYDVATKIGKVEGVILETMTYGLIGLGLMSLPLTNFDERGLVAGVVGTTAGLLMRYGRAKLNEEERLERKLARYLKCQKLFNE